MNRILLLLIGLIMLPAGATPSRAADPVTLTAPDGSTVTIHRDAWGVPHIYGTSETGVFYAQGYAVAQDRLWQMEIFRRAALGRLAEISPTPGNQQTDALVRAVFYTPAERAAQFAALPAPVQALFTAYVAGVNTYLQQILQNPALLPAQLAQMLQAGIPAEPWTVDHAVAVAQFFMRRFGGYGGQEVDRFLECLVLGPDFIRTFYPLNDPASPATIPPGAMPRPDGYGATDALADPAAGCPAFALPAALAKADAPPESPPLDDDALQSLRGLGRNIAGGPIHVGGVYIPESLGSFAVIVEGSYAAAGNVMLLGAPQLGPPLPPQQPFITGAATGLTTAYELELWDQAGDLHVGGMTVAGIPGVIIGRTERHAWSLTSGNSDNTDLYVEVMTSPATYLFGGNPATPFTVPEAGKVRSVHGPIVQQVPAGTIPGVPVPLAVAIKFTFWEQELSMVSAFYDVWKADDRAAFAAAMATVPMSFNVFYADADQHLGYWHVGSYQDRQDGVDPRFPHLGIGTQEWHGLLPFESLPKLMDAPTGFLANWNGKPADWWNNGDRGIWTTLDTGQPGDIRAERTVRLDAITDYIAAHPGLTFAQLKATPLQLEDAYGSYSAEDLGPALAFLDAVITGDRGTYQQAIEFLRLPDRGVRVRDENLVPPGQSGFISTTFQLDPHFGDQWPLHVEGAFKDMLFGAAFPDATAALCGPVTVDGATVRLRVTDTESGIAALRFVVPGGTASYRTLDGTLHGPFGHGETAAVAGTPAALDVEADAGAMPGALVVEVTSGSGLVRACPAHSAAAQGSPQGKQPPGRSAGLLANRPNPFNPSTVIAFALPEAGPVHLAVYDVLGRRVAVLVDAPLAAGTHEVAWDGRNAAGQPVAGGVYLYRLTAGALAQTRTMTLLK